MIGGFGRSSAIKLHIEFGEFAAIPPRAWSQAKKAMLAALDLYGFHAEISEGDPEPSHKRFYELLANDALQASAEEQKAFEEMGKK